MSAPASHESPAPADRSAALHALYRENAFRVLGLPADAGAVDARRAGRRLLLRAALHPVSSDTDHELGLPEQPITRDEIARAMDRIERQLDRMVDRLLWFSPIDAASRRTADDWIRRGARNPSPPPLVHLHLARVFLARVLASGELLAAPLEDWQIALELWRRALEDERLEPLLRQWEEKGGFERRSEYDLAAVRAETFRRISFSLVSVIADEIECAPETALIERWACVAPVIPLERRAATERALLRSLVFELETTLTEIEGRLPKSSELAHSVLISLEEEFRTRIEPRLSRLIAIGGAHVPFGRDVRDRCANILARFAEWRLIQRHLDHAEKQIAAARALAASIRSAEAVRALAERLDEYRKDAQRQEAEAQRRAKLWAAERAAEQRRREAEGKAEAEELRRRSAGSSNKGTRDATIGPEANSRSTTARPTTVASTVTPRSSSNGSTTTDLPNVQAIVNAELAARDRERAEQAQREREQQSKSPAQRREEEEIRREWDQQRKARRQKRKANKAATAAAREERKRAAANRAASPPTHAVEPDECVPAAPGSSPNETDPDEVLFPAEDLGVLLIVLMTIFLFVLGGLR